MAVRFPFARLGIAMEKESEFMYNSFPIDKEEYYVKTQVWLMCSTDGSV